MLSQGEPQNAAINFNMYQILQQHRVVSVPQHGFLVYIRDHSKYWDYNTVRWFSWLWWKIIARAENHSTWPKSPQKNHV